MTSSKNSAPVTVFWFRRDLRLNDNAGLFQALNSGHPVLPVFIFDRNILDRLEERRDRRVTFIHRQLKKIDTQLRSYGSGLLVLHDTPEGAWKKILKSYTVKVVHCNHDYEPYARQRDAAVAQLPEAKNIAFRTHKDQVAFEKSEVMKDDGTPYTVFTPFMKKWRSLVDAGTFAAFRSEELTDRFYPTEVPAIPALASIGFEDTGDDHPLTLPTRQLLTNYAEQRDIPSLPGTSRMSLHLRFGTVSVRELYRLAWAVSEKWVNELIWREFYQYILWHFPHVADRAFRPQYERLPWRSDEEEFQRWCEGKTGYPIVDAGMRELNATGFMHNRTRMITAMFLTKYLLIDWRLGEAYFAQKLLDFDLASNNGGWQWSAGTGVDAAPYFRIFSMDEQAKRFDPDQKYIRKWVPEYGTEAYPKPMIDYAFARKRCLDFFKS